MRQTAPATVDLPAFPPPGPVERIEFVEFTADAKEARVLGELLRTLGFAPVGHHVSKNVTLWQQGDIRLVVNSERSGFAHSAYVMHGTCVCDIGLLVGDAKLAIERAKALGAHPFLQRHNEGELNIPAIRGVGGTIVHFLDGHSDLARVWDTEFRPLPVEPEAAPVNDLTRIDHLAQTMSHDELTVWSQFYTTIFDLHRTSSVEITDPGGPVRSRAIESRDGSLRLTLNGADTHRTFAGRFMDEGAGPAVQHIAFEAENLIESADALARRGFRALQIPGFYYKNLAVWFDLSPEFIADLKHRNLLYDEDADGQYLQLYSLPYGDGFFFEIVQRSGGYAGYGARNAPYRTAALKRVAT